jgi:hypothetical protein
VADADLPVKFMCSGAFERDVNTRTQGDDRG